MPGRQSTRVPAASVDLHRVRERRAKASGRGLFHTGRVAIDACALTSGSAMKRTYQASKVRRARTHGFLVRMKTRAGRAVINARRAKGRKRLAV